MAEEPKRGRIVGRLLNFLSDDGAEKPAARKPPAPGARRSATPPPGAPPAPDTLNITGARTAAKVAVHAPPGQEELAKRAADQIEQVLKVAFQGENKFKRLDDNSFLLTSSKLTPEQVRQIAQTIAMAVAAKLAAAAGLKPQDMVAVSAMAVERTPDWPASADKQEAMLDWGLTQEIAEQHPDWGISRDRPEVETDWGESGERPEAETDWGQSGDRPESETEWGQSRDRPEADPGFVPSKDRPETDPAVPTSGERAAAPPAGAGASRAFSLAEAAAEAAAAVGGLPAPVPTRAAAAGAATSGSAPAAARAAGIGASQDRVERDLAFPTSGERAEHDAAIPTSGERAERDPAFPTSGERVERDPAFPTSGERPDAERAVVTSRDRAERDGDADWGQSRDKPEADPGFVPSKDRAQEGGAGDWGESRERMGVEGVDYVIGSRDREEADVDWGRSEERKEGDPLAPAAAGAVRDQPVRIRFRPFWNAKRGAIQGCVVQGERRDRELTCSGEIAYPIGCDEATAARIDDRILRTAIEAIASLRAAGTPALIVAPVRYLSLFGRERHKFIPMLRNLTPDISKLLMLDVVAVPADKSPSLLGKDIELFKAFTRFVGLRVSLARPQFFKAADVNAGFAGGDALALGATPGAPPLDGALLADFVKKAKAPGYESYVWNIDDAATVKAAAEAGVTLISGDPIGPAADQPTGARPFKLP